jgi:hypothetical protein
MSHCSAKPIFLTNCITVLLIHTSEFIEFILQIENRSNSRWLYVKDIIIQFHFVV